MESGESYGTADNIVFQVTAEPMHLISATAACDACLAAHDVHSSLAPLKCSGCADVHGLKVQKRNLQTSRQTCKLVGVSPTMASRES